MRVAVIILSLVAGLLMSDHIVIPMRLGVLIGSGVRAHEAVVAVGLFTLWTLATALVYPYPGVAAWLFALAAAIGLYDGVTYSFEVFTLWGSVAVGLAGLTYVAHREKQVADQIAWRREQHEQAVHAALRSLHDAVPELLSRSHHADELDPRPSDLAAFRPATPRIGEAARR